jgi:Tfp pilus assembly protein PilF
LAYRVWETQGILLCRKGDPDSGLKLLAKAVDKSKTDYSHHAWGNGSYFMEAWGIEALHANRNEVAEEAFLEALAHDPGSVRAALGLQILCERLRRTQEATQYAQLARRAWSKADPQDFTAEIATLRSEGVAISAARKQEDPPKHVVHGVEE